MTEVKHRWESLCRANPAYYDGRLYHVLGVHRNGHGGATLHVIDCAYRFFAVQDDHFDTGVRALGVKGVTSSPDGMILMGRRAQHVAAYRGMWEFAPAGSAEPGRDPAQLIQHELVEETGLQAAREPVPVALLFDPVIRTWELVYRIEAAHNLPSPRTNEYQQLQWHSRDDLPQGLSPIALQITELLKSL
ncbi:MAG: NUDIX hydrolase [Phycisphaerales bacterium]|nr:NUDIX hydrolase [Phycisphaerales bacterium]